MDFVIGHVAFSLEGASPFKERAVRRFIRHISPGEPPRVRLTVRIMENLPPREDIPPKTFPDVHLDEADGSLLFFRENAFQVRYKPADPYAELRLNTCMTDAEEYVPLSAERETYLLPWTEICLNSVIRLLVACELPSLGGLLTHAATVRTSHGAAMFLGESGAGKSTISLLAGPREVYSDELSILTRNEDGTGFAVQPSPFFGTLEASLSAEATRCETPQPLRAIYFLHQAQENRIEPSLSLHRSLPRLLKCVTTLHELPRIHNHVLDNSLALLSAVPAFELYFKKTPCVWEKLEEHLNTL